MIRRLLVLALAALGCGRPEPFEGPAFRRDPPQVGSLRGRVLTTNNGDDTLSVLDPEVPGPAQRLVVGFSPVELEGPHHVSVDPAGRFVYVNLSMAVKGSGSGPHGAHGAGNLPGYVVKIDTGTGRAVAWAQVDPNPGDNALSPDGRTLYVTHYDLIRWAHGAHGDIRTGDSNLAVIDAETMTVRARVPICPAAHGVRLSQDGGTVYATCGPDAIAVVDVRGPVPAVRRVLLPGATEGASCQRCPYGLAVAPDGTVWVSCLGPGGGGSGRGSLFIYDPRRGDGAFDPAATLAFRGSPVFAAFTGTPAAFRAYVPEQGPTGDFLRVYEPGTPPREVAALALPRDQCLLAHMLRISSDGRRGHLICEGDRKGPGSFLWLRLEPLAIDGAVPVGVFPDGLAWVP